MREHKRSIQHCDLNNALANRCERYCHHPDLKNYDVLVRCDEFYRRRVFESAFINVHGSKCLNANSGLVRLDALTSARIVHCIK